MQKAIELIVDGYVKLNDRKPLEVLKLHWQKLAGDLEGRMGFVYSQSIRQIDEEISVIEAGLDRLSSHPSISDAQRA